ncbi:MFS transporter [Streptomyces albiflavescens]|uniref:MFS transporter n=1 Tax=Streptomyces albiflavescens TaxID=1623582 RepID=A0A917XZ33_9ACTN|nr:MFS transporter [Streptomyces albiflavescens]GGN59932.1 MFS transporter [Streptomyces albiflavescens]
MASPVRTDRARGRSAAPARGLVPLFAIACGLTVGNLYLSLPLLDTLAAELHRSHFAVSLVVVATQAAYAVGLVLVVPLGDMLDRRRLVLALLTAETAALLLAAAAPGIEVLCVAAALIGLTSVVVMVMVPFAASLAPEAQRGRVVASVMSGVLIGSLLIRFLSGVVGEHTGWRPVYYGAAGVAGALVLVLRSRIPADTGAPPDTGLGYASLLRSLPGLVRFSPVLRRRSLYGALCFAAFTAFWTPLPFLLAGPHYGYGADAVGLLGLVGIGGVVAAALAGRAADRDLGPWPTGVLLAGVCVSFLPAAFGAHSLALLVLATFLLDFMVQGAHITNQSEIYRLPPEIRGRVTSVYMTGYFLGGAMGAVGAAALYSASGWPAVCVLGSALTGAAFLAWAFHLVRD